MDRRRFLQLSARSLGALAILPHAAKARAGEILGRLSENALEGRSTAEISLRALRRQVAILPGAKTPVWSFKGRVIQGGSGRLDPLPGS